MRNSRFFAIVFFVVIATMMVAAQPIAELAELKIKLDADYSSQMARFDNSSSRICDAQIRVMENYEKSLNDAVEVAAKDFSASSLDELLVVYNSLKTYQERAAMLMVVREIGDIRYDHQFLARFLGRIPANEIDRKAVEKLYEPAYLISLAIDVSVDRVVARRFSGSDAGKRANSHVQLSEAATRRGSSSQNLDVARR